jgi:hypothetical protein
LAGVHASLLETSFPTNQETASEPKKKIEAVPAETNPQLVTGWGLSPPIAILSGRTTNSSELPRQACLPKLHPPVALSKKVTSERFRGCQQCVNILGVPAESSLSIRKFISRLHLFSDRINLAMNGDGTLVATSLVAAKAAQANLQGVGLSNQAAVHESATVQMNPEFSGDCDWSYMVPSQSRTTLTTIFPGASDGSVLSAAWTQKRATRWIRAKTLHNTASNVDLKYLGSATLKNSLEDL